MGGALAALLTPVLNLLSGAEVFTVRTLVVAIISGLLAAVAVWVTDNADAPAPVRPEPKAASTAPATGGVAAPAQGATPIEIPPSTDFPGQTVAGE